MIKVTSTGSGLLVADCSECGWQCVGAPSDAFTRAVNRHVGTHRSPFGPVRVGLARPVDARPAPCRYADDAATYGPCGGPSNGRECFQHAQAVAPVGGAR